MAPGPKRKGRKDTSNQKSNVRQANCTSSAVEDVEANKQNVFNVQSDTLTEVERKDDSYMKSSSPKYGRRQIKSNWDRYEEHSPGLLEDTLRGESFEVLAGYQGGSDSYLKLKEEKEWCNAKDFQDGLCLDCDELAKSLKCIPFHKRLHLPEDCFTPEMIQKFQDIAKRGHPKQKLNTPLSLACLKEDLPTLGPFSSFEDVKSEPSYKPKVISEKTENIILSLTSCASLKDETPKTPPKEEMPTVPILNSSLPKPETSHDDLAFLLSLSGSDKQSVDTLEEKSSSASIEDWLNELLEK